MLPNFLVIGAAKAGTTSLHRYLHGHPEVFVPETKELSFFVEEMAWRRGFDWYERQFAGADGAIAVGEVSPHYALYPVRKGVSERIAEHLPDVRLVYLVRDPVERMRSHYSHRVSRRLERRPIDRALREDPLYAAGSSYAMQLDRYLRFFDRSQLLITRSEELRDDRKGVLARVYSFLGVDPTWEPSDLDVELNTNEGRVYWRPAISAIVNRPRLLAVARKAPASLRHPVRRLGRTEWSVDAEVSDELRDELRALLAPDVARLSEIAGETFEAWGFPA